MKSASRGGGEGHLYTYYLLPFDGGPGWYGNTSIMGPPGRESLLRSYSTSGAAVNLHPLESQPSLAGKALVLLPQGRQVSLPF